MKPTISRSRALCLACALVLASAMANATGAAASATAGSDPAAMAASSPEDGSFRAIKWSDLLPKDWKPYMLLPNQVAAIRNDSDPRAQKLLAEMREAWDAAPIVASMQGESVKLSGYVVPLEESQGELKEFLLVPYFGACIHTPPPPANQIVFIRAPKGTKFRTMETVSVSGTMLTTRQTSDMGASGYRIDATAVDRYSPP